MERLDRLRRSRRTKEGAQMTSEKTAWAQASSAGYGCWRVLCWRVLCWSGTTKVAQGKVTTSIRKLSTAHTMEERSAGEVLQREGTQLQPKAGRRHTVVRVRTGISLGARAQRIEAARDCSGSRLCGRRYLSMAQGTPLFIFFLASNFRLQRYIAKHFIVRANEQHKRH